MKAMSDKEIVERKNVLSEQYRALKSREPVPIKIVIKQILVDFYSRKLLPQWAAQTVHDILKLKDV